jgi:hypothetical protein
MVCVDLVGPFRISTPAKTHSPLALIMLVPAINTGWFEIIKAKATSIQDLFHNTWLAHYGYPQRQFIVFDNENRGKFKREFKKMCKK